MTFIQYQSQANWVWRPIYSIGSVRDFYAVSIGSQIGLAADTLYRIGCLSVDTLLAYRETDPHQLIDYGVRMPVWTVPASEVFTCLFGNPVRKQNRY